jgi:hypothetical protein
MRPFVAVVAVLILVLGTMQAASVALFGPIATPGSIPRALTADWPFALAAASGLDRLPPVRRELARAAVARGDLGRADVELAGLAPSADAEDLRARVAELRGDDRAAIGAYAAAQDGARAQSLILAVAARDPAAAFDLATLFLNDLRRDGASDPVVLAQAAWRAGTLAVADPQSAADPARRRLARSLYAFAVRENPEEETYWLNLGFEALADGDPRAAHDAYVQARRLAPNGIDAAVGEALADATLGDCTAAVAAAMRAEDLAIRQHASDNPKAAGFSPATIAALSRCR